MGEINAVLHGFSVGEVSNAALARVDQERLRIAAEIQENLLPHVIGKGLVRPGTTMLGNPVSNNQAKYLKFIKSPTDTALIECTNALARFWVSDALVSRSAVTSTVTNGAFGTASATVTITQANPGVVTWTAHGRSANDPVSFGSDTGSLPGTLVEGTVYYVKTVLTADTFTISATPGGSEIDTSAAASSGTLTGYYGWGVAASAGASATISSGVLTLSAAARGSSTTAKQAVATSTTGTEHALRITVTQGEVQFRVGSTDGGGEYIAETTLGEGIHSLAFTPSASPYYVQFNTRSDLVAKIDGCEIEASGVVTIAAPWSTSDLSLFRTDQSGDVLFLTTGTFWPRKIERRASGRSWSIVKYMPDDGPFVTSATNGIRLTAGAQYGITTVTASAALFTADDVGRLIRIFPDGQNYTFKLAGEDVYTEPVRLTGVDAANDHDYAITGTWSGTINRQLNFDDGTTGFIDSGSGIVANISATESVGATYDNVIFYVRYGFKPGGYTSGVATINVVSNSGGKAGVFRITGYNSATSVEVQVLSPPGSLRSTTNWSLGAWGTNAQWPTSVRFFDGRLWWGGLDKFWGSESDDYYAFNLDTEGAAGSIQRAVATGGAVNSIRWMLGLQRLILGTSGAEISVRSSSFDEPLTPTNLTLKDASTQGVAAVAPIKFDSRGYYVHRDGEKLFEIAFSVEGNDYSAQSMMRLNEDLGSGGIIHIDGQRSPEPYVWAVRSDGKALVLLREPAEKTMAWSKVIAAPSVAGAAVIEDIVTLPSSGPDRVYLVVKRTINGSTVRFLEKMAKHTEAIGGSTTITLDASVTTAGPVTTVSGLTHLVGETVCAWGTVNGVTGVIGTTFTVNGSGQITLPASATNVTVGLEHSWRYKSAKLAYGAKGGTALLQKKKVGSLGLLAENVHPNAIRYGADFTTMRALPRTRNGQTISETAIISVYDEAAFSFPGTWDTDSRVCLSGTSRYPATLNALVVGVETNEK